MAELFPTSVDPDGVPRAPRPRTIDEARAMARERFRSRLVAGEPVGGCGCDADDAAATAILEAAAEENVPRVVGVRFRDSGRTYYFGTEITALVAGDWVEVETSRGREAGRVVIAPHQIVLNRLQGELKPIIRQLASIDLERMTHLRDDAAQAVHQFGVMVRGRHLPIKPISAEFSFDGSFLTLNYAPKDRERVSDSAFADLQHDLGSMFGCRVEFRHVGQRDEARLLGGVGRCGRTLCCSSWLPVYPEISMNMAKTQDLPLNPTKVSGVCGRLLCCLSYENEQYKQMKSVLPRLGQAIQSPAGDSIVVSVQVLKELVTVRLMENNTEVVFASAELGFGNGSVDRPAPRLSEMAEVVAVAAEVTSPGEATEATENTPMETNAVAATGRRHRRRGRRHE